MGDWAIHVRGQGAHHNTKSGHGNVPEDVDLLAAEFVKTLKAKGHHVKSATITYGGDEDLLASAKPPAKHAGVDEFE